MTDAIPEAQAPSATNEQSVAGMKVLASFATLSRELDLALHQLEQLSSGLQIPTLAGREWFELLERKLLPQLTDGLYLVVAVVGGTNIGKSVIFNHIAGFRASSSSPLASGTKHPVCLVPAGFETDHDLSSLFPAFQLHPWLESDEALQTNEEHCLFWRSGEDVPENLIVLDTPDVDSDAPVNWQRADAVRQAADVLIAVLTQQKYNDAAVKQFFRKAAAEDKTAIVVFNRVELPEDEAYWPLWLKTFCDETGLRPEYVYLAPNDRKAAEAIRLEFQERPWNPDGQAAAPSASCGDHHANGSEDQASEGINSLPLRTVLSQLRFTEIKLQTMRGSLRQLVSEVDGVPSYLREIKAKSQQFRDAAEIFATRGMIRQADWPAAPNGLIIDEMWKWWDTHREVWTSSIHGFYSRLGRLAVGGIQTLRNQIWGPTQDPMDDYRTSEWDAIVRVIEQVFQQLQLATTLGNQLLTERLERLLAGASCEAVLQRMREEHSRFDFQQLAKEIVDTEMAALKKDHQDLFGILRNVDRAAAVVRPALTVLLAFGGGIGAEHLLMEAASQSVTHVAIDATAAAGTTVAGEAVVGTAGGLLGQTKAWLLQLHEKFKRHRETWLVDKLKEHLLGGLQAELQQGGAIPYSATYLNVKKLVQQFDDQLAQTIGR